MDEVGGYVEYRPSVWQRITRWLFPVGAVPELPERPKVGGYIATRSHVCLSWDDRIRLLFSSRIVVEMRQQSAVDPGAVDSASMLYVLAPWEPFPKH